MLMILVCMHLFAPVKLATHGFDFMNLNIRVTVANLSKKYKIMVIHTWATKCSAF